MFFYKTSYLNEEVNCTKPSSRLVFPVHEIGQMCASPDSDKRASLLLQVTSILIVKRFYNTGPLSQIRTIFIPVFTILLLSISDYL